MNFINKNNAECNPCKNAPGTAGSPTNDQKNLRFQGVLGSASATLHDVSTLNESATAPIPTGNTRGFCSPDVRILSQLEDVRARARLVPLPAFRRGRMFMDFATGKVRIGPAPGAAA